MKHDVCGKVHFPSPVPHNHNLRTCNSINPDKQGDFPENQSNYHPHLFSWSDSAEVGKNS